MKDYVGAHPGCKVVPVEQKFELYTADFRPLLGRVQEAKTDLFMADAHLEDFISMQRTYTQMGLRNQMITYGARGADEAGAQGARARPPTTSSPAAGGRTSCPTPRSRPSTPATRRPPASTPQWYHAMAYETARALLMAIQSAGSLEPEKIRAALAALRLKKSIVPGGVLYLHQDRTVRPALRGDPEQAGREGGPGVAAGRQDRRRRWRPSPGQVRRRGVRVQRLASVLLSSLLSAGSLRHSWRTGWRSSTG